MDAAHKIILFDGDCNLCNTMVQFIIKMDHRKIFKFASLQSKYGKELLNKIGGHKLGFDSIVLIEGSHYDVKSAAVLKIIKEIRSLSAVHFILRLIPEKIFDAIYTFTANTRYKLFGKSDQCNVSEQQALKDRFID